MHAGVSLGNAHPVDNVHSLYQGPAYPQQTKNAHPFDNALPTYPLVVEIFLKSFSERVPSDCRHCRLTSDIFTKEFFTSGKPRYTVCRLVEDKLLKIILRSELNEFRSEEEGKSELKVMLEIG